MELSLNSERRLEKLRAYLPSEYSNAKSSVLNASARTVNCYSSDDARSCPASLASLPQFAHVDGGINTMSRGTQRALRRSIGEEEPVRSLPIGTMWPEPTLRRSPAP